MTNPRARRAGLIITGSLAIIAASAALWLSVRPAHHSASTVPVICNGCPSPRLIHASPDPFTDANWHALLARPLRPPEVTNDGTCPITHGDDRFIQAVVAGQSATPRAGTVESLHLSVGPRGGGPVVIRAAQLNGSGGAIFDLVNPPQGNFHLASVPTKQIGQLNWPSVLLLALPTEQYPNEQFPSYFEVDQPGCYYLQFDGLDFSFTATFPMV